MASEVAHTKEQLGIYTELANKLNAENAALREQVKTLTTFFTSQIETITAHRDRLAVALRGLLTRFKVIREVFTQAETEALAEGLAANEKTASRDDGATEEMDTALRDLALHDPNRRHHHPGEITRLPGIDYSGTRR